MPAVDVTAAKAADGAIQVGLINANPNEGADVELALDGAGGKRIAGQVLTAAKMDSHNAFGTPEEVRPTALSGAPAGPAASCAYLRRRIGRGADRQVGALVAA